jgi:hypothetical protein
MHLDDACPISRINLKFTDLDAALRMPDLQSGTQLAHIQLQ